MRNLFPGHYQPTEVEFKTLWDTATFVVDANVLLNLYRYPKGASDDLIAALQMLQDRIWVPHQAALEYQENRLRVMADQMAKFGEVQEAAESVLKAANSAVEKLQLRKKYSLISPTIFVQQVATAVTAFKKEVGELARHQTGVSSHDTLRDTIDLLLHERVGPPYTEQTELDQIYKRGKERYDLKLPPGYADAADKKGSHTFGGLRLERLYGDLIVWEQLIKEAIARTLKRVIVVTDDRKEDWWWIVDSNGPKTIGPRPELAQELRQRAGVELFYMYSSEGFLKYAKDHLGTDVKDQSIEQVRAISESARSAANPGFHNSRIEKIVSEWLGAIFSPQKVQFTGTFPDIVVDTGEGVKQGFEVKHVRDLAQTKKWASQIYHHSIQQRKDLLGMLLTFVFVVPDKDFALILASKIDNLTIRVEYVIGIIDESDYFVPIVGPTHGMRG